ncbi:MAG: polyribonucleotide nucleotidyltransferase [Saprospiraceae bacterium]|nr:polyribonucleotide nucleotidyltransferase [Saprospiraceae bacterium]
MGKQNPTTTSFNLPDGREVVIETGKLATQANGSVVVRCGKTMIFAVVTAAAEPKPDQDFFPLSVDYQEKFAAAGRIPGNFFRREARLSDNEILISRLVDRALRPLFPDAYRNDTQIIINLISGDKETQPDAFVALAASAAIAVSDVPILSLISEVRVALIDGVYKINPSVSELANAQLDVIVGATMEDVTMVEGEAKECQEHQLVEAIKFGHEAIKIQIKAQETLAALVNKPKMELAEIVVLEDLKAEIASLATEKIKVVSRAAFGKAERKKSFDAIKKEVVEALLTAHGDDYMAENKKYISDYFDKLKKQTVRSVMLTEGIRLDGRRFDEVRPIWTEVDYLPSAHGSSIFNRGETQSLTSLTLGTKLDAVMVDNALDSYDDKFILHYNFPGFSVGEVKPQRGPGRREVGHANLAGRSLRQILPETPYTIRIVSDILESNGSSSMATVCAGSLALMDAGIAIPNHVAGIAMGMVTDGGKVTEGAPIVILSDILGDEDALGDMDFKVTGTVNGICGCQMDIKIDGLPYELLEKALMQAKEGRLHILGEMNKTISVPADDLKPHAPRVLEIVIDKEYIGAVIGPGGKIIQEMQRTTGTQITIEEKEGKGYVNIFASDKESIDKASAMIRAIAYEPSVGDEFTGKVATVMPYGVFIDFAGGKSGLLHVSEMSWSRIENVEEEFKEGDEVKFRIIEIDKKTGKLRLSRKAVIPSPDGSPYVPTENSNSGGGDRRGGGGGRDDRRGGGGGRDDRRGGGGGRDDRRSGGGGRR